MDINTYALEILAKDRLARARAEAAAHRRLASGEARALRVPARVSLGLALIGLGRWLRRAEPRAAHGRGVAGGRLGLQMG